MIIIIIIMIMTWFIIWPCSFAGWPNSITSSCRLYNVQSKLAIQAVLARLAVSTIQRRSETVAAFEQNGSRLAIMFIPRYRNGPQLSIFDDDDDDDDDYAFHLSFHVIIFGLFWSVWVIFRCLGYFELICIFYSIWTILRFLGCLGFIVFSLFNYVIFAIVGLFGLFLGYFALWGQVTFRLLIIIRVSWVNESRGSWFAV